MSKSLIVDSMGGGGKNFRSVVPRSTRNKPYNLSRKNDINEVNVSVIPPPTSVHQQEIINKRARKFSAKMSTAIGSERG